MTPFDFKNKKYHLGHLVLDSLKRNPDFICQIDAATGECETNGSVLRRSIQLARCMRRIGLKPGDVMTLGGKNHLDMSIPYYAAIMNGLPIAGLDHIFKYSEIKGHFKLCLPKIAFCEKEYVEDHLKVIKDLSLDTKLVCFGEGEYSMQRFMDEYDDINNIDNFAPLDFDKYKNYAFLITTSGTMSVIKLSAFTHANIFEKLFGVKAIKLLPQKVGNEIEDSKPVMLLSPLFWLTSFVIRTRLPYAGRTILMTSAPVTSDHVIDMINKYKPIYVVFGPSMVKALIENQKECDFTCFELILISGSKIQDNIILELKNRVRPSAKVSQLYGLSEVFGALFSPSKNAPINSCGKGSIDSQQFKLVDPVTGKDVTEPNVPGEIWVIPAFTEFYNDPELTASAVTKDGWYKSGDILYRDENDNYFFVERIKTIIICRSYHVIPAEFENVILKHPGVKDVAVTSIPHEKDGQHPVACVVKKNGANVTAQELRDMIADALSASTQLLGGVVFIDEIPLTSSGKVALLKLQQIALTGHRE